MATQKSTKKTKSTKIKKSSPTKYQSRYGKRPLWQWVLLYAVLGVVVYGIVYYIAIGNNKMKYNYNSPAPTQNYQYNSQ